MTVLLIFLALFLISFIFKNYIMVFLLASFTLIYTLYACLSPPSFGDLFVLIFLLQFISAILLVVSKIKKNHNKLFYIYIVQLLLLFSFLCFVSETEYLGSSEHTTIFEYITIIKYLLCIVFGVAIGTILKTLNDLKEFNKYVSVSFIIFLILMAIFFSLIFSFYNLAPTPYLTLYLSYAAIGVTIGNNILRKA